jgi:hypothetical protein
VGKQIHTFTHGKYTVAVKAADNKGLEGVKDMSLDVKTDNENKNNETT